MASSAPDTLPLPLRDPLLRLRETLRALRSDTEQLFSTRQEAQLARQNLFEAYGQQRSEAVEESSKAVLSESSTALLAMEATSCDHRVEPSKKLELDLPSTTQEGGTVLESRTDASLAVHAENEAQGCTLQASLAVSALSETRVQAVAEDDTNTLETSLLHDNFSTGCPAVINVYSQVREWAAVPADSDDDEDVGPSVVRALSERYELREKRLSLASAALTQSRQLGDQEVEVEVIPPSSSGGLARNNGDDEVDAGASLEQVASES